MGLVINRPLELTLSEIARQHGIAAKHPEEPVFFGGPVEVFRGLLLHRGEQLDDDRVIAGPIKLNGSVDVLTGFLEDGMEDFRLYLGYAGWGPGQLDAELASGSWMAANLDDSYIFDLPSDQVWDRVLADMGISPATVLAGEGEIV